MKCKFCGCTENRPCRIPITFKGDDDEPVVAFAPVEALGYLACAWLIDGVCSAPACVSKAYAEAELLADQLSFFIERSA